MSETKLTTERYKDSNGGKCSLVVHFTHAGANQARSTMLHKVKSHICA